VPHSQSGVYLGFVSCSATKSVDVLLLSTIAVDYMAVDRKELVMEYSCSKNNIILV
jgi:hypothetical protein